jgi:hypothetical protein
MFCWMKTQPKWLVALLLFAVAAQVGIGVFYNEARFFIPDEIVYYLMNEALSAGRLAIDVGYEDFASPMFVFNMSSLHEGRIYPQYPAGYAFVTLPLFLAYGKAGLFAVNSLCFGAILWLVYRIQMLLFTARFSAWAAVAMTAFGGYMWVYSHAIAPHLLQVSILLGAAYLMLQAFMGQSKCSARSYVFAGLLFGLALTVRYDSLFALPMLLLPLVFANPVRWRALALIMPGIALALAFLSITNFLKFGSYMPFTYDSTNLAGHANFKPIYVYMMLAGAAFLAVIWAATRLKAKDKLPPAKPLFLIGTAFFSIVVALLPDWIVTFLYGLNLTVVDYASLPLDAKISDSATRTEGGGFLYLGEYKRALLQSAPFIALLGLLLLQPKLKIPSREWVWLVWLALVPTVFIFFFSLLRWDGGFAYHMRYYIPTLPFFAMIAAQALWRFVQAANFERSQWTSPIIVGVALSIGAVLYADGAPEVTREWMLLQLPLWLWMAVLVAGAMAFYDGAGPFIRQLAMMVFGFCITWGGASSMLIIYPHLNDYKKHLHLMSASCAHYLQPESVVISVPRYFTSFYSSDQFDLHVATIYTDGDEVSKEHMRDFIDHFLDKGVAIYITHDMKSLPLIRLELDAWGMKLTQLRPDDAVSNTPALSQFSYVEKVAP